MGQFLDRLRQDNPAYSLEASDSGYLLIRREGQDDSFNEIARELLDEAGAEFVVFPTPDHEGYERVFLVPL